MSNTAFVAEEKNTVVHPLYLIRFIDIPPVDSTTHSVESLYFTDEKSNVTWFDENDQSCTYLSIGMSVDEVERSKDETTDQCRVSLDNVPNTFTSLAQYYKLNGVKAEVYKAFTDTLSSTSGATLYFSGKIRSVQISQYQVEMMISNGFDDMDKIPKRMCWTSLFPYIPSAKDPREIVTMKK